jgi:hypothetical protein
VPIYNSLSTPLAIASVLVAACSSTPSSSAPPDASIATTQCNGSNASASGTASVNGSDLDNCQYTGVGQDGATGIVVSATGGSSDAGTVSIAIAFPSGLGTFTCADGAAHIFYTDATGSYFAVGPTAGTTAGPHGSCTVIVTAETSTASAARITLTFSAAVSNYTSTATENISGSIDLVNND